MTFELFFYYLKEKCKLDPQNAISFWQDQFDLLKEGVTDARMHDSTLVFGSWYEYDYLKGHI